jgi:UDP-N-acetyl-D-glucosamine dehydrogenase
LRDWKQNIKEGSLADLLSKIENKTAKVAILGMGYVGLPLAMEFNGKGYEVIGIDVDEQRVDSINRGVSFITDVPSDLLNKYVSGGLLGATTDFKALSRADGICICVPTPLRKTKDPDISYIMMVLDKIKQTLRPGQLIVLESTTYPGTTDEILLPELESTGLKAGKDFYLAFSPERVDPGNKEYTTGNTPKIIAGITPACSEAAKSLYEKIIKDVIVVSSTKAAEMVKLLENTFRAVNIGLVNEIAIMCDRLDVDTWEVINAAATKPYGFMPFYPGPGLGGHCIPIDPLYLSWKLKTLNYNARFIELASEINSNMPLHVVRKVTSALNEHKKSVNGSKILILGVSYKKDIADVRESPALDIINILRDMGAEVLYNDPYVAQIEVPGGQMRSSDLDEGLLSGSDCTVIVADHASYDWPFVVDRSNLVVDTRNATAPIKDPKITKI